MAGMCSGRHNCIDPSKAANDCSIADRVRQSVKSKIFLESSKKDQLLGNHFDFWKQLMVPDSPVWQYSRTRTDVVDII